MEDSQRGLFNREFLDKWYSGYHRLEAFVQKNGTAKGELSEELARWAEIQRGIRHMLPAELRGKLESLDYDFEDQGGSWGSMYRQLAAFVRENGHPYLPADREYEALKDWLIRQVLNKSLLSESQFRRLDSLGVDWEMPVTRDHRWELMLTRLKEFHKAFGHCRVPQKWENDMQLAHWVTVQRRMHVQGKLREDRERKLSELDFVWNIKVVFDSQWEQHFEELASFYRKHGHCRVPGRHRKLESWIERQRTAKVNNLLSGEREKRLNGIGFIWSFKAIKKKDWKEKYRQLRAFERKNGHSFVPVNYKENKALGTWVATQRWLEAKGRLCPEKREKLNALGFVWSKDTQRELKSIYGSKWEASFEKLKAYKQAHGTCQVSLKVDPALQRWACWQRKLFYQDKLSAERIGRLNGIGFPWSTREGYWMRMYNALVDFKNSYGHTRVPYQGVANPQLAAWVYRTKLHKAELESQKIELLDQIGFDWTLNRKNIVPWGEMYARLVAFKRRHGHARVPVKWPEDPKLGKWVSRMRLEREKLTPQRASLLEAIGFYWDCRPASVQNYGISSQPHLRL